MWLKILYAFSATPIYPSTTYCGNAKKLMRTREITTNMDMKKEQCSNGNKGVEKIIHYAKKNRTVQRNIGVIKTTVKISKTTVRRKRTNQEGDDNEERSRRTDEDASGI
jgi:hypothetical protein